MGLSTGDNFPSDVTFSYVPYTPEKDGITACGIPVNYNASKEWTDKKVIIIGVPGAFTPSCSERHVPGVIENLQTFKDKGVDIIAVISVNDGWVMSAWRKAYGLKDEILFLSDSELKFSQQLGWVSGDRPMRFAIISDHGVIKYGDVDEKGKLERSSAQTVLSKL